MNSYFEQVRNRVDQHVISFQSESLIRALNGETFNGQYECTLANGDDFQTGVTYDILNDFTNCSTENGGFTLASLSTVVNQDFLYLYAGSNGPCAVSYGPLVSPVDPLQELVRDPLTVGGGVFVRLGDVGCNDNGSCIPVSRGPGVCDSTLGSSASVQRSPLPVYVTDPDGLDNSVFEFTIVSGNIGSVFAIDASTGQLSVVGELDRDLGVSNFNLVASVSDGVFSDTFNVAITVTDVNDNDPVPDQPQFTGSVFEEAPPLTPVVTVTFSDDDSGENAVLTYSLVTSVTAFIINATTGEISTNRILDYEANDQIFNFIVTATDGGNPPRQGTVQVTITVIDLNDNRPTVSIDQSITQFVEDGPPVSPADVTVDDRDSSAHPIFYAIIAVQDNLDGDNEVLSLPLGRPGFRVRSSNESILIIVGRATPSVYSVLLSATLYENTAELITLPLVRTISYSVCDVVSQDTMDQLSPDTVLALNSLTAVDSELPEADADLLISACQDPGSNTTLLELVETNDRPVIIEPTVSFPSVREDTPEVDNRGSHVIDIFGNAIFDPDRDSRPGIAVIGRGNTAEPEFASLVGLPSCRSQSDEIINNSSYQCSSQLAEGGECYCPEGSSRYTLTCNEYLGSVFFICLYDNSFSICQCDTILANVLSVEILFSSLMTIDISSLSTNGYVTYEFDSSEQRYDFTFSSTSIVITFTNLNTITLSIFYTITFESFGVVSDDSALLLGPYAVIRWNPLADQTGFAYFNYRAWDGSNGLQSGVSGVNTSIGTSFSLEVGNATVEITPVNDPPEIRLGGPDEGQLNFAATYVESGASVFISSRDAVVIELDNDFLFNLSVRISTVGGGCDLPDYDEQSDDQLSYLNNTMLSVTVERTTEGRACVYYNFIGALTVDQWRAFITMLRFSVANGEPSEHTREISLIISDTVSTSQPSFSFIDVTLVSDLCPVIELPAVSPIVFIEHNGPIVLSDTLNVTDPDRLPTISGAIVTIITTPSDLCGGCVLSVDVGTTGITPILSVDSLTLTLSGIAPPSDYESVLRTVMFDDVASEPSFNLVRIRYTIQDPEVTGACPDAMAELSVMVEHINDNSPILYLDYPMSQDFTSTFMEGAGAVPVTGARVEVQDSDGLESSIYTVSVEISDCNPAEDRLEFVGLRPTNTLLFMLYDPATCSLTIGGSSTELEFDLQGLTYNNIVVDDPTPSVRPIIFTIVDDIHSNVSETVLTVEAVNDEPVVDLDTTSPTSDSMVTMILGTGSIQITEGNQGNIVDPDTDNLVSMTLVLTEVDGLGGVVDPRTDREFESLQSEDPAFILNLGLTFQYLQASGELRIAGTTTVGEE